MLEIMLVVAQCINLIQYVVLRLPMVIKLMSHGVIEVLMSDGRRQPVGHSLVSAATCAFSSAWVMIFFFPVTEATSPT